MKAVFIFTLIFSLFCFYGVSLAQGISQYNENVSIDVSPEFPDPESEVTLRLESFSFDLDTSNIQWLVNEKEIASGKGLKKIKIFTGKAGEDKEVLVKIITSDGDLVEKSFNLNSSSVDLIYEANTYTHPFFKGKALFSSQSSVTLVAKPHIFSSGREVDENSLVYKWSKNDTIINDASGYNKKSIRLSSGILGKGMQIDVEVTDPESYNVAHGSIYLEPTSPIIMFYENNPLYGPMFNKALVDNYELGKKEISIFAVPYFFSTNSVNSGLEYIWKVNDKTLNSYNSNQRAFRVEGNDSGASNISLTISSIDKILQTSFSNFNVLFHKNNKEI